MTEAKDFLSSSHAAAVVEKLEARKAEREQINQQRLQQLQQEADPRENISEFLANFSADHDRLRERCSSLQEQATSTAAGQDEASKQAVLQQLEELSNDIAKLEQNTSDAAYFLPSYELRSSNAQLQELRSQVAAIKQQLQPKRKFAFSKAVTRKAAAPTASTTKQDVKPTDQTGVSPPAACEAAAQAGTIPALQTATAVKAVPAPSPQDLQLISAGYGCMGLRDQVVVIPAQQLAGQAFVLHDLANCTVFLLGHLRSLRLQQLQGCKVYTGPVSGAAFISGADSCTLMVASHQVRIHDARDCDFYLRVRSRPIIEHSSGLRFAPYPVEALLAQQQGQQQSQQQQQQHGLCQLLVDAQLSEDSDLWQQVDDFGWVKATQSPNWSVLPEQERQQPGPLPAAAAAAGGR